MAFGGGLDEDVIDSTAALGFAFLTDIGVFRSIGVAGFVGVQVIPGILKAGPICDVMNRFLVGPFVKVADQDVRQRIAICKGSDFPNGAVPGLLA